MNYLAQFASASSNAKSTSRDMDDSAQSISSGLNLSNQSPEKPYFGGLALLNMAKAVFVRERLTRYFVLGAKFH